MMKHFLYSVDILLINNGIFTLKQPPYSVGRMAFWGDIGTSEPVILVVAYKPLIYHLIYLST